MWIFVKQTQRYELVVNQEHIARLLADGGVEVSDPRVAHVQPEQVVEQEPEHEEAHEEQTSKITDISKRRRRKAQ